MLITNISDNLDYLNCTYNKYIINEVVNYLKGTTYIRLRRYLNGI